MPPLKDDYRQDPDIFEQVLELAVMSLDHASRNGVRLQSGRLLFPIPVGHKGDWAYLVPGCQSTYICLRLVW